MTGSPRITRLLPSDEPVLRLWARDFLVDHLRWWSDAAELGWSETHIHGHLVGLDLVERDVRRLRQASGAWERNFVGFARDGEVPLGAVWAESTVDPFLGFEIGAISWIHVAPDRRGQGVGGALVAAAQDWMRARKLPLVQLHVVGANAAAVRMYERAGLRVVDHRMLGRLG